MNLSFQCAVLLVNDVARSKQFYGDLLGLKVESDFGPNVSFGGFAIWHADHARQIMGGPEAGSRPLGQDNLELYFESTRIDEDVAALAAAGVQFVHGLIEQPWSQRVVRFRDPDGHIVEIGEPMDHVVRRLLGQGLPVDEVCQRSSMPRAFVEMIQNA